MQKIKKGDTVKVLAGKDKGRTGIVEQVFAKEGLVLLPGINLYKKHLKERGQQQGGVIELPRPLPLSKVALVCPHCQQPTRVGFQLNGEKKRVCKKCGKEIEDKRGKQ